MDDSNTASPPPLPPRPLGPRDPVAPASPFESYVPAQRTVAALNRQAISLYVVRLPGTENLLITPTRPASSGITHFDVTYGAFMVQYDDQELYKAEVEQFVSEQAQKSGNEATQQLIARVPAPSNVSATTANAKKSTLEETALDKLLREEMEREAAEKSKPFAQLQSFSEQILSHNTRNKALPDQNELRNLHQAPLAARGLLPDDARPMILHRIGVLPGQSREIGEVARMLDTWRRPTRRRFTRAQSRDGLIHEDEAEPAGYIDMLERTYEPFGIDVNYISPSWIKVFTRRLSKWKGHIDEDFVVLSPWQGHLVFQSSKVRNSVTCWHIPPNSNASERVIVSELRLNVYPQASTTRKSDRPSSSDENRSISPVRRSLGTFPVRMRARGASESSPLNSVTAAAESSDRRDSRITRLLHKVAQGPRGVSPPKVFRGGRQERPSSSAALSSSTTETTAEIPGNASDAQDIRSKRNSVFNFHAMKARFSTSSDDAASSNSHLARYSEQADLGSPPKFSPPHARLSPKVFSRSSTEILEATSHSAPGGNTRQSAARTSTPSLLDLEEAEAHMPMDLSLGQEKLGGGIRGRDAKLAKIVVHGEGQQMLDLVIAANMILFSRAFALSKGDF